MKAHRREAGAQRAEDHPHRPDRRRRPIGDAGHATAAHGVGFRDHRRQALGARVAGEPHPLVDLGLDLPAQQGRGGRFGRVAARVERIEMGVDRAQMKRRRELRDHPNPTPRGEVGPLEHAARAEHRRHRPRPREVGRPRHRGAQQPLPVPPAHPGAVDVRLVAQLKAQPPARDRRARTRRQLGGPAGVAGGEVQPDDDRGPRLAFEAGQTRPEVRWQIADARVRRGAGRRNRILGVPADPDRRGSERLERMHERHRRAAARAQIVREQRVLDAQPDGVGPDRDGRSGGHGQHEGGRRPRGQALVRRLSEAPRHDQRSQPDHDPRRQREHQPAAARHAGG